LFARQAGDFAFCRAGDVPVFYLAQSRNFASRIAKDCDDSARLPVDVDECAALNAVVTFPADGVVSVGFLEVDGFWIPIAGESGSKLTWGVQHPCIPGFGRKEYQRADGDKASIEQELKEAQVAFRKNDNAFLAIDDVAALQAAADRLSPQIIQKQIDYWTLILGPKFSRAERHQINLSRFYAIAQIEYCRNFIFKRNFPIHKIFERSCEIGLWRLTANRISELFGVRLHKRLGGKLGTVIDQIEHGHHVFRAYWKNAFLKQYEKFSTLLRNELCSNNLSDFALKKGLQNLNAVRSKFLAITDRFARLQAQWLNVHVDFPLLQRMALPITTGSVYYPGIKIHETRIIRLLEVLLHAGNNLGGWSARQIHQVILQSFQISEKAYGLNQLRYDLRKLKGHDLLERDGSRYAYRLTSKGFQVALLFLFFHKRLCGPLANSRFHHQPDADHRPKSKLEAAYYKADRAIQDIVNLLDAAWYRCLQIFNQLCRWFLRQESMWYLHCHFVWLRLR
jgi:hypothetical protein